MKKVIQDKTKCIGCLACVGLAPDLFAPDENDGLAKLLESETAPPLLSRQVSDEQVPEMLASACCGGAISVEDVESSD